MKPFPTTVKTVGDLIRVKRLELRIKQHDLAVNLGVPLRELRNWEMDLKRPTDDQCAALARVFGLPEVSVPPPNS